MEKHRFTLVAPKAEFQAFAEKCARLGLSQTEVLRSFMRGYVGIEGSEFCVLPLMQVIALGETREASNG